MSGRRSSLCGLPATGRSCQHLDSIRDGAIDRPAHEAECMTRRTIRTTFLALVTSTLAPAPPGVVASDPPRSPETPTKDDGYRGIWYSNQPTGDRYRYKYSGGFAT